MKLSAKYLLALFILPIIAYKFEFLSFIAFIPIFFLLKKKKGVLFVFLYLFPFYLFIYSGIYKATHTYYGLFFPLSVILVVLLATYQSIFIILSAALAKKFKIKEEIFPFIFVGFEFIKNKLFYGMPLGNLNILTYKLTFFIQDASLFGSLFIDLKILMINLAIFLILKGKIKESLIFILIPFVFIPFAKEKPKYSKKTTISIVQGNIPQNQKWEEKYLKRNLNIYLKLSNNLESNYVFWPESAYPYLFEQNYAPSIRKLIKNNTFYLVFGAVRENKGKYYNSVILYAKNRISIYDKQKLVPFAEFIPFASLFNIQYSFSAGTKDKLFKGKIKIAPMICYEENFESIAREYKNMGAELLAVFTNDAWFDKTPTFYLLPRSDIYRAIENRTWLIRVANTGISFIVDAKGNIISMLKPDTRAVLTRTLEIKIYPKTFYDKIGWLFGWFIVILIILLPFCKKCKNPEQE